MPNITNIKPGWITKSNHDSSQGWTSAGNRAYKSARWKKLRILVLNRDPICKHCNHRASYLADHIQAVELGGEFWDMANLQGMCSRCHNSKSGKEGSKRKDI